MKFNEKLINLRKKEGLSQEELGYKLNVTRQTISKWELGQTTPEMDKLVEISKFFNISVDDLINEGEIQANPNPAIEEIDEQPIEKESSREKVIKFIIVGFLIIVIVLIVIKLSAIISDKWKEAKERITEEQEKNKLEQERQEERQDKIYDTIFDMFDNINQTTDNYNEAETQIGIKSFNARIEMYNGTKKGAHVISLLDNIITSNKTQSRKITVKYQEIEIQGETEIKNIKRNIGTFDDYEVTFEYDENGFINKATIEKL